MLPFKKYFFFIFDIFPHHHQQQFMINGSFYEAFLQFSFDHEKAKMEWSGFEPRII